jgi:hypothetical protein
MGLGRQGGTVFSSTSKLVPEMSYSWLSNQMTKSWPYVRLYYNIVKVSMEMDHATPIFHYQVKKTILFLINDVKH